MSGLPGKIVALHKALGSRDIAHAFGGALALAWCTQRARGTIDIDLNVFLTQDRAHEVVAALPRAVAHSDSDVATLQQEGQTRLWWDDTPIDVFLNTTAYHEDVARRIRWEPFVGEELPFLSCTDLAVFKAFFNRTRDWADLEEMVAAGALDRDRVLGILVRYLGVSDERVERLQSLRGPAVPTSGAPPRGTHGGECDRDH
jgi:hypothetical protein